MTAEIAVLNKEGVALAADSAVTSEHEGGRKIFTSANKIFALSKYAPVAVMVYGNAQFMNVPWETIVKIYRRKLGKKEFATLKEHADNFLKSLETDKSLFPQAHQKGQAEFAIYFCFQRIKERIERAVKAQMEKSPLTGAQLASLVSSVIRRHHRNWQKAKRVATLPEDFGAQFRVEYQSVIDKVKGEVFEKLELSGDDVTALQEIAGFLFERWGPFAGPRSGIVVAGYGRDEIFPALYNFEVEFVVNDRLKYAEVRHGNIGHDNEAWVVPFAQREMVHTFMQGIDPDLANAIDEDVTRIITDLPSIIMDSIAELTPERKDELRTHFASVGLQELEKYRENFRRLQREKFTPVLDVVGLLPKDELAALAESLVNLTSLKRRVSPEAETVAGPIDVAVISKGDGLIWIKRKHYFTRELNPQFFANYLREETHGGTEGGSAGEGTT